MKHRCSGALHLLADNTSLKIEYRSPTQPEWHRGSFYVLDKADRDEDIHIRIIKNNEIIWRSQELYIPTKGEKK